MEAMNGPLISVITACFNCEATILDTIRSVNAQTYPHIEHVFVDGGSTDNTLEEIHTKSKVVRRVISERDRGIYDALNKGLQLASGDVVGFLHADDFYAHDAVLASLAECFADPSVQAVYGDLQYVNQQDVANVVRHWSAKAFSMQQLKRGWMPPHPTLYVRKDWYARIGGFNTSYRIAADYDSMLKLFTTTGFKSVYLPAVLVRMRTGGASNRSLKNIVLKSREDYRALRANGVGGVSTLIAKNVRKFGQFSGTVRVGD